MQTRTHTVRHLSVIVRFCCWSVRRRSDSAVAGGSRLVQCGVETRDVQSRDTLLLSRSPGNTVQSEQDKGTVHRFGQLNFAQSRSSFPNYTPRVPGRRSVAHLRREPLKRPYVVKSAGDSEEGKVDGTSQGRFTDVSAMAPSEHSPSKPQRQSVEGSALLVAGADNDYERERALRIAANQQQLRALELNSLTERITRGCFKSSAAPLSLGCRGSSRRKKLNPVAVSRTHLVWWRVAELQLEIL